MSNKLTYTLECTYCGKIWQESWVSSNTRCSVCKDKNIKKTKNEKTNFYGYEEEQKEKEIELDSYDDLIRWSSD